MVVEGNCGGRRLWGKILRQDTPKRRGMQQEQREEENKKV
jgi:hypothetical protein